MTCFGALLEPFGALWAAMDRISPWNLVFEFRTCCELGGGGAGQGLETVILEWFWSILSTFWPLGDRVSWVVVRADQNPLRISSSAMTLKRVLSATQNYIIILYTHIHSYTKLWYNFVFGIYEKIDMRKRISIKVYVCATRTNRINSILCYSFYYYYALFFKKKKVQ